MRDDNDLMLSLCQPSSVTLRRVRLALHTKVTRDSSRDSPKGFAPFALLEGPASTRRRRAAERCSST